jgi:hypothetical protein
MNTSETKPNEPGIWQRDETAELAKCFVLVYQGQHLRATELIGSPPQFLASELTGNWRKLTAEPPTCETAKAKFLAYLKQPRFITMDEAADKAAEIFAGVKKSIPLERHYKQAAKDIGDFFCWCVTHLTKFPPGPGVEWLDDVKRRLSEQQPVSQWQKQPGELFDKRGVPVHPGDLIRSYHFRDRRGKYYYLYHTAVFKDGAMYMVPTEHLEPTKVSGGGSCMLSQELMENATVISGCGPKPYLDFSDRPRRKASGNPVGE